MIGNRRKLITSHQFLMASTPTHTSTDTEKKSKMSEKQIAKEEFSNYKYAESMASTPTQEHLIKKNIFLSKQNQIANNEFLSCQPC